MAEHVNSLKYQYNSLKQQACRQESGQQVKIRTEPAQIDLVQKFCSQSLASPLQMGNIAQP